MQAKKLTKIGQGAEAVVYRAEAKDSTTKNSAAVTIIKDRVKKSYRLPEIDVSLRKARTRREAKILGKLKEIGLDSPQLIMIDDKNMILEMDYIDGPRLRDVLRTNHKEFSREIGRKIALLHNNDIIHGDLTTSNMILDKKGRIHFIDFGLSSFSARVEDKAVDLHLVRHALESKHYEMFEECFEELLKEYKKECRDAKLVLSRLEKVEARGRNKEKA